MSNQLFFYNTEATIQKIRRENGKLCIAWYSQLKTKIVSPHTASERKMKNSRGT